MISFKIKLAGTVILVGANYPSTKDFCREYLTDKPADISVNVDISDIIAEEVKTFAEENRNVKFPPQYLETLALYRKIAKELASYGIILFHGSALSMDGEAYIFTAKSGIGKSTHASVWRRVFADRVVMINDDKPLIAVKDGEITVYGTPWCGKHNLGNNISVPLKAICILERGEDNIIKKISPNEALGTIFAQTYRFNDTQGMKNVLYCVDKIIKLTPTYILRCNMNDEAAQVAYEGMKGEER